MVSMDGQGDAMWGQERSERKWSGDTNKKPQRNDFKRSPFNHFDPFYDKEAFPLLLLLLPTTHKFAFSWELFVGVGETL